MSYRIVSVALGILILLHILVLLSILSAEFRPLLAGIFAGPGSIAGILAGPAGAALGIYTLARSPRDDATRRVRRLAWLAVIVFCLTVFLLLLVFRQIGLNAERIDTGFAPWHPPDPRIVGLC